MDNSNANNGGTSFNPNQPNSTAAFPTPQAMHFDENGMPLPVDAHANDPAVYYDGASATTNSFKAPVGATPNQTQASAPSRPTSLTDMAAQGFDAMTGAIGNIPNSMHQKQMGNSERITQAVQTLENIQTQSVVESARDANQQDLQRIKEMQIEQQREAKKEKAKAGAKRALFYFAIFLFAAAFIAVVIFFLSKLMGVGGRPVDPEIESNTKEYEAGGRIGDYKCEKSDCKKIAEVPDGRIIIRDGEYYLYNAETKKKKLTTMDNVDYNIVRPFMWHDKIYAILDQNTGRSAIFSITDNRIASGYNYDVVYTDPNDEVYAEMRGLPNNYIVAKTATPESFYLLNLDSGVNELVGDRGVLQRDGVNIAYNGLGQLMFYQPGRQDAFYVANPGEKAFIRDTILIIASQDSRGEYSTMNFYSTTTAKRVSLSQNDVSFYEELRVVKSKDRFAYISSHPESFIPVPENKLEQN